MSVSLAELKLAPDAQFDLGPLISSGAACRGYLAGGKDIVLVKTGSDIEISSSHGGKGGSNVNVNGVALELRASGTVAVMVVVPGGHFPSTFRFSPVNAGQQIKIISKQ